MTYKKFEKIKLNIIRGRKLLAFPTAKIIQDHEDRLKAIEGGSMTGSESTEGSLVYRVKALETILGDTDDDTVYNDAVLDARISALEDKFRRDLSFTVKDSAAEPAAVEGAVVTVTTGKTGTTGSAGGCSITGVLDGTYTISVVADGFEDYSDEIVVDESHTSFNISLTAVTPEAEEPSG